MGIEPTTSCLEGSYSTSELHPQTLTSLARPGGFEPPARGLELRCSIHLSYGRKEKMVGAAGFEPTTKLL